MHDKFEFHDSLLVMPSLDYDQDNEQVWHAPFAMLVYKHQYISLDEVRKNDPICEGCGASGTQPGVVMFYVVPQHKRDGMEPTLAHCYDCLEGIYQTTLVEPWDITGSKPIMFCPPPAFFAVRPARCEHGFIGRCPVQEASA